MQFKDSKLSVPEIAKALNVDAVVKTLRLQQDEGGLFTFEAEDESGAEALDN